MNSIEEKNSTREWQASLELDIDHHEARSRLIGQKHFGPLRVLRPYYPEGKEVIHLYLIHPPGGLVCGDHLDISLSVQANAKAVITTPSAGKIYATDQHKHPQIPRD